MPVAPATRRSAAYEAVRRLIDDDVCVVLDGGLATELERARARDPRPVDDRQWGAWALHAAPYDVLGVHRAYVDAGCDVVTTNTWAIPAIAQAPLADRGDGRSHWMDLARLGIRLARQAVEEAGRAGEVAVAFGVSGDVPDADRRSTLELLTRVFEHEPPDLVLLETMTLVRDGLTLPAIEAVLGTGLPVWLSFRRCRHGVCGVYGQHWGPPEGDEFGRAARRFEALGAEALLINCLPPQHVGGMLPWLRDFVDLPLGVYPNLGYETGSGWHFDETIGPEAYAELAAGWRAEGAQIIGGCCGTHPEHVAALHRRLRGPDAPPRGRPPAGPPPDVVARTPEVEAEWLPARLGATRPWLDEAGGNLFPLPVPDIVTDRGVFVPTQGSFLVWKHLFRHGIGRGRRCLDVGCGSGILTVQLALNGAEHVHALDVQREAVANTLANAFRNGVADRVSGAEANLYAWEPDGPYDVVVASMYQMPVDPYAQVGGHRPLDFWGRNLFDHLITLLPALLAEGGVAYLMQLSILSQLRTAELLEDRGLTARPVDFGFFPWTPVFGENREQIERVEELSDAYHLRFGADDVSVAYLLEVTRRA